MNQPIQAPLKTVFTNIKLMRFANVRKSNKTYFASMTKFYTSFPNLTNSTQPPHGQFKCNATVCTLPCLHVKASHFIQLFSTQTHQTWLPHFRTFFHENNQTKSL